MTYDPDLLDELESLEVVSWSGVVFRYRAGPRPPEEANSTGSRWNPPQVPAIYTSLERETVLAEFEHLLSALSPRPRRSAFTLYEVRASVENIVDLRGLGLLEKLGVGAEELGADNHSPCQRVGGAASWLPRGGLLVPSARRSQGSNLVIFPHDQDAGFEFEVIASETMPDS